ncbi:hypothetical protein Tco_0938490 [Tanacetum coccineum]|uniref:Reverse transcriptase domain-containing protein n=1 Tax=Tanacetum coccineum TaxID=301880 RepID=A0ABQ5DHB4_9ASTR
MRANKLYKFSNGTLKTVWDEIHHRILYFRLGYNKEMSRRKWTATDKRRSKLMVELIDKQIRERRIVRNLERLVRSRGSDFDIPVVFSLVIALLRNKMVTTCRNSDDDVPNFEAMIMLLWPMLLPYGVCFEKLRSPMTSGMRGGDAVPMGFMFGSKVLGCPDNFKTRLAAFKLEGDALSWWKAHLRTQVGGDAFADTCTWVAFREIFYNRYFPASGSYNVMSVSMGRYISWIERILGVPGEGSLRLASFVGVAAANRNIELLHESGNSNKRDRDGNRIQNRGQGNRRKRVVMDRDFRVGSEGLLVGMGMDARVGVQRGSTETLPLHLFVLPVEKPHRVFVIRLLGMFYLAGFLLLLWTLLWRVHNLKSYLLFVNSLICFPDELLDLLLERLNLALSLIPVLNLSQRTRYRMAPVELKDFVCEEQDISRLLFVRVMGHLQLNELNELRDQAYENSLIYKERTKKLHDSKIKNRIFNVGDQVLLFNSRLKIFSEKLKTRWSGPFTITEVFPYGTTKLSHSDGSNFKVNCHRLKHYFGGETPPTVIPNL